MKKLLLSALLLCTVVVFAGCDFKSADDQNTNPPAEQQETPAPEQEAVQE